MMEAKRAGLALQIVADRLLDAEIVEGSGYSVLSRLAGELKGAKTANEWRLEVDRGEPIRFSRIEDKAGRPVVPSIVCAGIHVQQGARTTPPFKALDIALEFSDELGGPVARWHLDLANEQADGTRQQGPLTHLQYGGHLHGARHLDHPLKAPRWCHPPMEVALLCEVVAANFFEKVWLEFRDDPNWCQSISLFETLCYTHYAQRFQGCLNVSSSTALNSMWANSWY